MFRRWLIRIPFLLALAFVVGVWVTSYSAALELYKCTWGRSWMVGVFRGSVFLLEYGSPADPDSPIRFFYSEVWRKNNWLPEPRMLGFYGGGWPRQPDSLTIVFPLWLPTLLLAGLNWFVWRKTRAKHNGRGFPVEVVKKAEG